VEVKRMSTLHVVEEVLRDHREPLVVREIVQMAGDRLPTRSRTPDTVVARDLAMDLKRRGDDSIFARVAPGRYTLKVYAADWLARQAGSAPSPSVNLMTDLPVSALVPPPSENPPEATQ
jgi:hypothetical protein